MSLVLRKIIGVALTTMGMHVIGYSAWLPTSISDLAYFHVVVMSVELIAGCSHSRVAAVTTNCNTIVTHLKGQWFEERTHVCATRQVMSSSCNMLSGGDSAHSTRKTCRHGAFRFVNATSIR